MGEAVIVAGVGFKRGTSGAEIVAAVEAALSDFAMAREKLTGLATSRDKSAEVGVVEAASRLGLSVTGIEQAGLNAAAGRTLTRSERSLASTGLPSLSEAAALAAAGPGSRLLGPRLAVGPVTCALAESLP